MTRKIVLLASLLLLAACAAKPPAPQIAPPVPIPQAPPPRVEPPGFAGLSPDAIKSRLGAPAFSRKDGVTEMWRYDASACHAFFFFTSGQVTHVETIPRSGNDAADAGCLSALRVKKNS